MKRLNTVYATLPDAASNYNAILEIHSRGIERFSRIFVSIIRRYCVNGEFFIKTWSMTLVHFDLKIAPRKMKWVTMKYFIFKNIKIFKLKEKIRYK